MDVTTNALELKTLSIIIPVFNEANTIHLILNKVRSVALKGNLSKEIILVDDCSSDASVQKIQAYIAQFPNEAMQLLTHPVNQGKGAAIHSGIKEAKGELIVIQDADLEYDPDEFNDLLEPFLRGQADVVFGSRFMGARAHRVLFFWHSIGNKMLTFLSNMFSNVNLTDMETCYKMFDARILKKLHLNEKRFGFEPEVTAKIARVKNVRIYEVGISYYGRTYDEGKKINWKDGFRAVYCIFKYGLFGAK